jgi:short-subunit dehydrogenase
VQSPIDDGVVLITGASSGIGREVARLVARRARAVVLVARRKERLDALAGELRTLGARDVLPACCDVTDRASCDAMLAAVEARYGGVDVLVNNAGLGDLGVYDRTDWSKTERMIALNVTSLAYLTHRLVGRMVARGRGAIVNVSSGLGLTFVPGMTAYTGTKYFVTGFTEGLRLDLAGTGVSVSQVCPGPVATEFEENVGNFVGRSPPAFVVIGADRCARAIMRAIDRRRALVIPGFVMRVLITLGDWTPRPILRLMYAPLGRMLRARQAATRKAE